MPVSLFTDRSVLDFLIAVFAIVAMPALSVLKGRQLARQPPGDRDLMRRYLLLLVRGWLAAAAVIGVWLVYGRPFTLLGLSLPLGYWDYGGLALCAAGLLLLPLQLRQISTAAPDKLRQALKHISDIKILPDTGGELALFVAVAVTAGVWEEIVYRGFLIWFFLPATGAIGAAVVSSLIFGGAHLYQGVRRALVTVVMALVLAALYLISGSLWWLMAVHAVIDLYGGFTAWRVKRIAAAKGIA